tara:strand:- start:1140 stop:1325 length:186 start_codon:yes stop_codon:yes gene_type:complete
MIKLKNLLEEFGSLTIIYFSSWANEEQFEAFDLVEGKEIINNGINQQYAVVVNGERFTGLI